MVDPRPQLLLDPHRERDLPDTFRPDVDFVEGAVLHEHDRVPVGRERESCALVQVLPVDREGEPRVLVSDEVP